MNSLQGWESGRQTPKGKTLSRTLDALRAPERTKARLLAAIDPAYARIALARCPLGPPLGLSTVLRAMRTRRGVTQTDLARSVGVTQSAVAKWETGDSVPSASMLHAVGYALGATVEETLALASAQGGVPDGLPAEPGDVRLPKNLPMGLQEIVSFGQEAELWRRAAVDACWEPSLAGVLAYRANLYAMDGRFGEIPEVAERALRLATTVEGREAAVPAVNALTEAALRRGGSPGDAARTLAAWAERLPRSRMKAWILGAQGLNLARVGRLPEALELTVRARDMDEDDPDYAAQGELAIRHARAVTLAGVLLESGHAEEAAREIAPFRSHDSDQVFHAQVVLATGRPLDEPSLAYLRHYVLRIPGKRHWKNLVLFERIEADQARLTGEPPASLASSEPDEAEARRLWSAVPGGKPWPA